MWERRLLRLSLDGCFTEWPLLSDICYPLWWHMPRLHIVASSSIMRLIAVIRIASHYYISHACSTWAGRFISRIYSIRSDMVSELRYRDTRHRSYHQKYHESIDKFAVLFLWLSAKRTNAMGYMSLIQRAKHGISYWFRLLKFHIWFTLQVTFRATPFFP